MCIFSQFGAIQAVWKTHLGAVNKAGSRQRIKSIVWPVAVSKNLPDGCKFSRQHCCGQIHFRPQFSLSLFSHTKLSLSLFFDSTHNIYFLFSATCLQWHFALRKYVCVCVGWRSTSCTEDHPLEWRKKCNESAAKMQQRCKKYSENKSSRGNGQKCAKD